MGAWKRFALAALAVFFVLPAVARAESEVDILLDKLVERKVISSVDAGLIRREINETKEVRYKQMAKEIVPDSARNWKWSGDLRLRDEMRNRQGTGNDSHRQRIRFRFGSEGKVSDTLKAKFRIATGTGSDFETGSATDNSDISRADPISTNDTFDDFFRKKPIVLDLANVEWSPEVPGVTKFSVVAGIIENPMWTVTPMVWDGDLSWDGAAIRVTEEVGPISFFSNGGAFALDSDESEPAALYVAQGGASIKFFPDASDEFTKNLKLTTALAYHDYVNVANSAKAGTDPLVREADNTTATDFNQFNPSIELASQYNEVPFSIFGDWVHNISASSAGNDGFAIGAKVGKASVPFSVTKGWEAGYMFERLERDAAFDEFVDSDFGGGGTNRRGNVIWANLAVLKNSTLGLKYFFKQNTLRNFGTTQEFREDRAQLDWVTKF